MYDQCNILNMIHMEQCRVRKKWLVLKKKMFNLSRNILVIRVEAPLSVIQFWLEMNISLIYPCVYLIVLVNLNKILRLKESSGLIEWKFGNAFGLNVLYWHIICFVCVSLSLCPALCRIRFNPKPMARTSDFRIQQRSKTKFIHVNRRKRIFFSFVR